MQKLKLNLVVVGIDGTGMGHWAASVCRSMGIPTIVCQEGIPWTFELHDPYSIKFKRFLFNVFSTIIYPHARCFDDYKTAEYVAVWGKHTKDNCIAHGLSPQKIMIVGDPRIKPRAAFSPKKKSDIFQLLFLDIPVTTLSKGVFNSTAHTALRKELIHLIITQNYHLIYKPHPFTQSAELESIYELTSNLPQVELITSGVAEDLYARSDAGLTFPSTCVCSILAFGLPLIQIHSDYAGFTKLLWDPASEHQAGFTIKQIQEIPDAVRQIQQTEWRSQYWEASRIAAEEVVGPLDGNAPERFAEVVRNILKVPKIV